MRLDFNVLWVDDLPAYVEKQITRIGQRMAQEGFEFKPIICESLDAIDDWIAEGIFEDEIDLIIVDWDLGSASKGEQAIAKIREYFRYKDIVFYSGETDTDKLRKVVFDNRLEGIYCVSRPELVEDVIGVFESLVRKVLDLDHTRGIVMGATSDIDHLVKECLQTIHDQSNAEEKESLLKEFAQVSGERAKRVGTKLEKLLKSPSIEGYFKAHNAFTSFDRLTVLKHLLEEQRFREHSEHIPMISEYLDGDKGVSKGRNRLGHIVFVPGGKAREVSAGDDEKFTLEEARELRKKILISRAQFRALLQGLRPKE